MLYYGDDRIHVQLITNHSSYTVHAQSLIRDALETHLLTLDEKINDDIIQLYSVRVRKDVSASAKPDINYAYRQPLSSAV